MTGVQTNHDMPVVPLSVAYGATFPDGEGRIQTAGDMFHVKHQRMNVRQAKSKKPSPMGKAEYKLLETCFM